MENFYLILVIVLFALAISDLIVGVSNDAVNFLNSAIGSKVASKWMIFSVASLGVLIGATFSSGMMEVARKGIFHPDMFYFSDIIVIFLAVMITDVVLLDLFNTFGLPTSTTVSLVFELLGSAVAVSLVKISRAGHSFIELSNYINSDKALAIITGILVSVVISFTVGAIIQYIARFVFSFKYQNTIRYFGSVFGGMAITFITYFILIKGVEGSAFAKIPVGNGEMLEHWVNNNTTTLLLYSFIGWSILMEILRLLFRTDVLKVIVLVGTFALAMAFAGNDLVNFIGVPIAGFKSYEGWVAAGHPDPGSFSMDLLKGQVETPAYMLLIAGIVMIITLITSKKAKAVVTTTVDLSRQAEGIERFGSSAASRVIVRSIIKINKGISRIVPLPVSNFIENRFKPVSLGPANDPATPAFDKIRASVNLIVSSVLIAFGTSLKLPLSTTYVTFMVAMGTSLSDRAWDRESAVFRISGVIAVISGWFLTALIAFTVSSVIAFLIMVGGHIVILIFMIIAIGVVVKTHTIFKKRSETKSPDDELVITDVDPADKIVEKCRRQVSNALLDSNKIYSVCMDGFLLEKRGSLKKGLELKDEFNQKSKKFKSKVVQTLSKLQKYDLDSGHFYVQVVDYQRELAHSLNYLTEPMFEHINNNHKPLLDAQLEEFRELTQLVDEFFNMSIYIIREDKFDQIDELIFIRNKILDNLIKIEKNQIKRIRTQQVNSRNSVLFLNILTESKNMLLHSINLIKSHRDFIISAKEMPK